MNQPQFPVKEQDNVKYQQDQKSRNQEQQNHNLGQQQTKTKKLYYKYCCNSCIHLQNSNKSCVCIVPRSKRKKTIGEEGCQTCKCRGCTAEDQLIRNQEQRKRKKNKRQRQERSRSRDKFNPENGCCKKCIRALSKNRKACLCQVPRNVRKTKLPPQGCKQCGCHGCHPRDNGKLDYSSEQRQSDYEVSYSNNDQRDDNLNNVEQSIIGKVIANEYNLYGPMLGLGIPQRTPSYILGRPI